MLVSHVVTSTPPSPTQTNISVDGLQICHHHRLARAPCHTQGGWQRALCPQDSTGAKHHKFPKKAHRGHQQQSHGPRSHLTHKKPYVSQIPDGVNLDDFLHQKHKKRTKRLAKAVVDIPTTSEENTQSGEQPLKQTPSRNQDMEVAALAKPQGLNLDEIENIMQTFTVDKKTKPREKELTNNPPVSSKQVANKTVDERLIVVDEEKLQVVDEQSTPHKESTTNPSHPMEEDSVERYNHVNKNHASDSENEVDGELQESVTPKPTVNDKDALPHPSQSAGDVVDSGSSVYVSQVSHEGDREEEDVTVSSNTRPRSDLPEEPREDKQTGKGVHNVEKAEYPVQKAKVEESQKPDEAETDMEEPQTPREAEQKMEEDPQKPSEADKEKEQSVESQQPKEMEGEKDRTVLTVGVGPIFVQDAEPQNQVIEATEGQELAEETTPIMEESVTEISEVSIVDARIKSSSKTTTEDEENAIIFPTKQTEVVTSGRKPRFDDNIDTPTDLNSDNENEENEGAGSEDNNSPEDQLSPVSSTQAPKSPILFPEADNGRKEPTVDVGLEVGEEEEEQQEEEEDEEEETISSPAVGSSVEDKNVSEQEATQDEETTPEADMDRGTITESEKSSTDEDSMDDHTTYPDNIDDDDDLVEEAAVAAQPSIVNQGPTTSQVDAEIESTVDPSIVDIGDLEINKEVAVMDTGDEENSATDTTTELVNEDGQDKASEGEMEREPKTVEVEDQPDLSNSPKAKENKEEMSPEGMAEVGEALDISTDIPEVENMGDKLSIPEELKPSKDPTADKEEEENPNPDQEDDGDDVPSDPPKRNGHQGLLAQIFKGIFG
ncbi:hypothetical protein Pcinc_023579 [Petrolisthes cinctipes]|uniref:Uncharacterized protein n=1 Tax=Petrolisthes cinctipes TaxID=88211 RepID=A0AAE1FF30_PETCI|nr:hypothetical protein Pcinc_023579 [Petrolisthes cinctipes]